MLPPSSRTRPCPACLFVCKRRGCPGPETLLLKSCSRDGCEALSGQGSLTRAQLSTGWASSRAQARLQGPGVRLSTARAWGVGHKAHGHPGCGLTRGRSPDSAGSRLRGSLEGLHPGPRGSSAQHSAVPRALDCPLLPLDLDAITCKVLKCDRMGAQGHTKPSPRPQVLWEGRRGPERREHRQRVYTRPEGGRRRPRWPSSQGDGPPCEWVWLTASRCDGALPTWHDRVCLRVVRDSLGDVLGSVT